MMKIYDESKNYFILKNMIIHSPPKCFFSPEYLEYTFACVDLYEYNDTVKYLNY
jgi:hypothetical protein